MSPATGADNAAARDVEPSILSSSALMAAGTVVSRLSGFVRNALLAAALGQALHADVFTIANTIPNMLYILLAGGVFNAVLVPQLVRAMRNDPDGGDGLHQPDHHPRRGLPRRRHRGAGASPHPG